MGSPTMIICPPRASAPTASSGLSLRGFVHDDQVKGEFTWGQVLSDGQGSHHEARLQSKKARPARRISCRIGMWRFCLLISWITNARSVQEPTGPTWLPEGTGRRSIIAAARCLYRVMASLSNLANCLRISETVNPVKPERADRSAKIREPASHRRETGRTAPGDLVLSGLASARAVSFEIPSSAL